MPEIGAMFYVEQCCFTAELMFHMEHPKLPLGFQPLRFPTIACLIDI